MTFLQSISDGIGVILMLVSLAAISLAPALIGEWVDARKGSKVQLIMTSDSWRRFLRLRRRVAPWSRHPLASSSKRSGMVLETALEVYERAIAAESDGHQLFVREKDGTIHSVFMQGDTEKDTRE